MFWRRWGSGADVQDRCSRRQMTQPGSVGWRRGNCCVSVGASADKRQKSGGVAADASRTNWHVDARHAVLLQADAEQGNRWVGAKTAGSGFETIDGR